MSVSSTSVLRWCRCWLGGQGETRSGGLRARSNRTVEACCHGHPVERCSVARLADGTFRAGTATRFRRIVGVVAFARAGPVVVAAARVRFNAMTARTSQAAFAVNTPDDRCASAEFLRSAWTCSMIASPAAVRKIPGVLADPGHGGPGRPAESQCRGEDQPATTRHTREALSHSRPDRGPGAGLRIPGRGQQAPRPGRAGQRDVPAGRAVPGLHRSAVRRDGRAARAPPRPDHSPGGHR